LTFLATHLLSLKIHLPPSSLNSTTYKSVKLAPLIGSILERKSPPAIMREIVSEIPVLINPVPWLSTSHIGAMDSSGPTVESSDSPLEEYKLTRICYRFTSRLANV
jgi:hypothetical protein